MLWWMAHEPDAPELVPGDNQEAIFTLGRRIGELARTYVPGGVLIDIPYDEPERKVAATAEALAAGAPVIYEASFIEDDVFVSVDILERSGDGFFLVEVKATLKAKPEHIPDVAIQHYVLQRAGLLIKRAQVMHLNRDCRYPDLSNLFVRSNVTPQIGPALSAAPRQIDRLLRTLQGPLPHVSTGAHCWTPYACPFIERCWPVLPEHHVSTLYRIRGEKVEELVAGGYKRISDLPIDFDASGPVRRQIEAVRTGKMIVEPGLGRALVEFKPPVAFLDFETINPAIPVWPGCRPYDHVPVQFSCHVLDGDRIEHHQWIADGPDDPREPLARELLSACEGASTILAYNAPFERRCFDALIDALPHLAVDLSGLNARLKDLLPIVRDHVYHPDFGGSFSIKDVVPALVPGLGYDDLKIGDGMAASAALERLLLVSGSLGAAERDTLRSDVLRYCERDTLAMVRLYQRLYEVAPGRTAG